jgi:superfamily II DNA or RNA helicase
VVVHRQQLLDQWQERLGMFLDLPAKAIGHVGGGKTERTGCVDVAVIPIADFLLPFELSMLQSHSPCAGGRVRD